MLQHTKKNRIVKIKKNILNKNRKIRFFIVNRKEEEEKFEFLFTKSKVFMKI